MEVEQLKKEVRNSRAPVSLLFPSLPLFSIPLCFSWSRDLKEGSSDGQWGGGPCPGQ